MSKKVFMFPGQGAQKVGMGEDLYQSNEAATHIFDQAQAEMDFDLLETMFKDQDQKLGQTEHTQPALLTHSIALYEAMGHPSADFTLGHSLGEYASLVMSGVLRFEDAVKIVRRRGELMAKAFPQGTGGMAAVLGLDLEDVQKICDQLSSDEEKVEPANINSPGQIVVSGDQALIDKLVSEGKSLGAKRVLPLQVSGPFHSSMMQVIEKDFAAYIDQFEWHDAQIPVVQNVHAQGETDAETIKQHMIKQLYASVQFIDSVEWLIDQGVDHFIEIGPNKVLSGLVKKINRDVKITSIQTIEDVKEWLENE
ncbi:ACP S-malonyltransferase [Staphylococcus sp. 11261D007BR]